MTAEELIEPFPYAVYMPGPVDPDAWLFVQPKNFIRRV